MKSKCCSLLCWDSINPVICNCIFSKVCHDHFCTVGTSIKWTFKIVYIAVLVGLIKDWKKKNHVKFIGLQGEEDERTSIQFENLLILYGIQHLIFIVFRPLLFLMWTFMTCCCQMDEEYPEDYNFDDSIISFNYIKYHREYFREF